MTHLLAGLFCLTLALGAQAQTRSQEDRADTLRRCGLTKRVEGPASRAVRCAEWFVARQGYTGEDPVADTNLVVSEGIEWTAGRKAWLAGRRRSLQPRALGICKNTDGTYVVAFLSSDVKTARGVDMDERFGSLRVHHADFNRAILFTHRSGCHALGKVTRSGSLAPAP